jgi:hypothetical protein
MTRPSIDSAVDRMTRDTYANGGATYPPTLLSHARYIVGGIVPAIVDPLDLRDAIRTLWNARQNDTDGIGTWTDDGHVYVDIVRGYERKRDAMRAATAHRERAVYDVARHTSLRVTV